MAKQIQHKSMRGKKVDMDLLRKKNELTPAIGNARVNARGDELGPGGKIVRKREEIVREYYEKNPNAVRDETGSFAAQRAQAKANAKPAADTETTPEEKEMFEDFDQDWVEDENGNFTKKGE